MKDGKLAEACDAFDASNRIEPRAGTLIRLGECRERNHQLAAAWSAYKDALTRVKDAKKRAIATKKVAELEPKLSYLTIAVADASKVDGLAVTRNGEPFGPELWNRQLPVDGGTYAIEAKAPHHREWKTTATVPEASSKISVDVPRLEETHDAPPAAAPVAVAPPPPPPAEPSRWTGRRKVAVIAAGVGIAAAAAGVTFAVLAQQKLDSADGLCPSSMCTSAMALHDATIANDDARSRATVANVSFGVAGAAAVLAGVLWFTGAPERTSVVVAPAVSPGAATLTIGGAF